MAAVRGRTFTEATGFGGAPRDERESDPERSGQLRGQLALRIEGPERSSAQRKQPALSLEAERPSGRPSGGEGAAPRAAARDD
jgi:hypothetical protein